MIDPALEAELAQWRALGFRPRLWWRDDDARRPTPALERLLALADTTPLTLAIVPAGNVYALTKRLAGLVHITIAQHGVDHVNRRRPGMPPGENPLGASAAQIALRIAAARERMTEAGLPPALFVPPWNRIDKSLSAALRASGFAAMSAWGGLGQTRAEIRRLDTHLDVVSWTRPARFKGETRLIEALRQNLVRRRTAGAFAAPIGLLTHHLALDPAAWSFLTAFVTWSHSAFGWMRFNCSPAASLNQDYERPASVTASSDVVSVSDNSPPGRFH
jgi:predicted deacetylase